MKPFGCKQGNILHGMNSTFPHDGYDYELYFTPDPPHMLKLARNALCEVGVLVGNQGKFIEWKFIQRLHEEQVKVGLKFANKLSRSHLNISRHKMNVRIAAQTLSNSVDDAIGYLMLSAHLTYKNAEVTIESVADQG